MSNTDKSTRNRKALSNALLTYFILKENGSLYFLRSKIFSYALKIISGSCLDFNGETIDFDHCEGISNSFVDIMKKKTTLSLQQKRYFLVITKEDFEQLPLTTKNTIYNANGYIKREAINSNTLTLMLIKLWYKFISNR